LSEKTKVIKQKVFIPAKSAQVYDAYVNAKKHSDFTGGKGNLRSKSGRKVYSMGWLHHWKEFGIDKGKENSARMDDD
jgi:hypothetical protein